MTKASSGLARVVGTDRTSSDLQGQFIYFSARRRANEGKPIRSTEIEVVGVISALGLSQPPGSFDEYLSNAGVNFKFTRGRILEVTSRPPAIGNFANEPRSASKRFSGLEWRARNQR